MIGFVEGLGREGFRTTFLGDFLVALLKDFLATFLVGFLAFFFVGFFLATFFTLFFFAGFFLPFLALDLFTFVFLAAFFATVRLLSASLLYGDIGNIMRAFIDLCRAEHVIFLQLLDPVGKPSCHTCHCKNRRK